MIYTFGPQSFSSGVASDRLDQEIRMSSIALALRGVRVDDGTTLVEFSGELSTSDEQTLDAIVATHLGAPLPNGSTDSAGNPVVAPTFLFADERARLRGFRMSCPADEIAIIDVEVTTQLLVQGADFWVMGAQVDDKASFAVVDKADVLGLHTAYSIPIGTPIELTRYVADYPLPTSTIYEQDVTMPTVAPIAAGLFLRCIYDATPAGSQREIGVVFKWYEGNL